jgi:hypothetical protein
VISTIVPQEENQEAIAGRLVDVTAAVADVGEVEGEVARNEFGHLTRGQGLGEGVGLDMGITLRALSARAIRLGTRV